MDVVASLSTCDLHVFYVSDSQAKLQGFWLSVIDAYLFAIPVGRETTEGLELYDSQGILHVSRESLNQI